MSQIPWAELVAAAAVARSRAYAPYSGYLVGAALLSTDGRIFAGCNVENASYGLALCAERGAVAALVAAGGREIMAVAVVTQGPEPGAPCGLCRQTLSEFASDLPIGLAVEGDSVPRITRTLRELFPEPFRGDLVKERG
jgi:cytidine deaminase